MSKRGLLFVTILLIFSASVRADSKIIVQKEVVAGSQISITIDPDSSGVYKEIYLIDSHGNVADTIVLDCNKVCYNKQTINYQIKQDLAGSYTFYIYDYSINNYLIKDIQIANPVQQASLQQSLHKVNKYFITASINSQNSVAKLESLVPINGIDSKEIKGLSVNNKSSLILSKKNSRIILSSFNSQTSPQFQEVDDTGQYILELQDEPEIAYQIELKTQISYYGQKVISLENVKGKRNLVINIINDIKLSYYGYKSDSSTSSFSSNLVKHRQKVDSNHESIKSKIRKIKDANIIREYDKTFNGIVVKTSSLQELSKITGVKKIHKDLVAKAFLNTTVPIIGAPDMWSMGYTGTGVKIAIIDTGVDYTHPDLGGCFGLGCKVAAGHDFVTGDNDPMDENGHGTHVAAIAAGDGVFKGVAPNATIYSYRVLDSSGSGYFSTIISAIEASTDPNNDGNTSDHLDVISLSLGGYDPTAPDDPLSIAVDNAVDAGVTAVIAAGNSGPIEQTIGTPGTARKAITVAASTRLDQIAYFSSRGPVINKDTLLIKPEISAPGTAVCSAQWDSAFNLYRCDPDIPNHVGISGTSMATPHVSGVVALLKQAHPDWTPAMIKSAILLNAKDMGYDVLAHMPYDSFTQGSGRVDSVKAFNTSIFVDKPVLSFNNLKSDTNFSTINIKSLRNYPITITFSATNATKTNTNQTYSVLTFNTSSMALNPNETKTLGLLLSSPTLGGLFSGVIYINESSRQYRIPYAFLIQSKLTVKAISSGKILAPTLAVADKSLSNAFAATSGWNFYGDEFTFTVEPGNYTVYAMGDNNNPDLEYILMSEVTVPKSKEVRVVLSTNNARKFRLNTHSLDNRQLYLETYLKDIIINTTAGIINLGSGSYGSFYYKTSDREIYISDTPKNSDFDVDISILYSGIPSQDLERKQAIWDVYATSNSQYLISWYLTKIDSNTPTYLSYNPLELAIYNLTYDYPASIPAKFKSLQYFIPPYAWFTAGFLRDMAVPLNKAVYLRTQNPIPNKFDRNWSFYTQTYVNYIRSSNPDVDYGYGLTSFEYYKTIEPFYSINPKPGEKENISFGKTPLRPAQIKVVNEAGIDKIVLTSPLVSGYNGKSAITQYPDAELIDYFTGQRTPIPRDHPSYSIYSSSTGLTTNGTLLVDSSWDSTSLNYPIISGAYSISVSMPITYSVWNWSYGTATISNYPSSDNNPPLINYVLVSPRFDDDSNLEIIANITDDLLISSVDIHGLTDTSVLLTPIATNQSASLYGATLHVPSGAKQVELDILATDSNNNVQTLHIAPASLPARTISLTRQLSNPSPLPGQEINISGVCIDNLGISCTDFRLIHYLNGNLYYFDTTHKYVAGFYNNGSYMFNWIAQPFIQPNFTTIFEGSGLFKPYGIQLQSLSVSSSQRDLGIRNLVLTNLIYNQTGAASFTLYNAGQTTETNIPLSISINSIVVASATIPSVMPGSELSINISFIPKQIKNSLIKLSIDAQDDNKYNNVINKTVFIDYSLPDIHVIAGINGNPPFVINNNVNRTIQIYNLGKVEAKNILLTEYIISDSKANSRTYSILYGNSSIVQFNNIGYTVLINYANITHKSVRVTTSLFTDDFSVYSTDVHLLPDSTLMFISDAALPTQAMYTLANNYSIINTNIPDLQSVNFTAITKSLTPSTIGNYIIYGKLSTPNDAEKSNNFYTLSFDSLPLSPDLTAFLVLLNSQSNYISINKSNLFTVFIFNIGGLSANNVNFELFVNSTLTNSSNIGEIPALTSFSKFIKLTPKIQGSINITLIAHNDIDYNLTNNIVTKNLIAVQTKNSLFTMKNSSNNILVGLITTPLTTVFGKIVSSLTSIELPYKTPFLLGTRRSRLFTFGSITSALSFTYYYRDTVSEDLMTLIYDRYENLTDNNIFAYYLIATNPSWQYSSTAYSILITNSQINYISGSDVFGCLDWDFPTRHCTTGWNKLAPLRQYNYLASGAINLVINGSTSSMEAYALGYDTSSPTTSIYTTSGGGGGGGGGGGYSSISGGTSYSAYSELLYYKLINKDTPFLGYTKSPLIDIRRIGISTDGAFSKNYIKISEYTYLKSDVTPNSRLVYSFFDVDHIQIPRQSILSSNITFRVPISWLATYILNPESIILQRYTGSLWQDLATNLTYFDSDYYYYIAEAPGLSTFAITYNLPEYQQIASEFTTTSIIEQQQPIVGNINKLSYIIPAIFIVLALILFSMGRRNKKNPFKILLRSIEKARKQGFSDGVITKEATEQGWPEDLIRQSLNKPKF